jgi:hypothetical protein
MSFGQNSPGRVPHKRKALPGFRDSMKHEAVQGNASCVYEINSCMIQSKRAPVQHDLQHISHG